MAVEASTRRAPSKARSRVAPASPDYVLVLVVAALLVFGLVMLYSASFDVSNRLYDDAFHILSRQFIWAGVGVVVLAVFALIPYDRWRQLAVPVLAVMLVLLVLVLIIGDVVFGAKRSFLNGSVQPGELAKLAMVIYVATWLSSKGEQIRDVTYGLAPFAVLIGLVAGLIVLQPDLSTAVLITLTAVAMFFLAGADIFQLAISGAIGLVTFIVLVTQFAHAKERMHNWLLVLRDPKLVGDHMMHSLVALGSGGPLGLGLGQGKQKLTYLPLPHTDSIFAVIGEELGFLGCIAVIALFVLLAYRGLRIAEGAPDTFSALLACGITIGLSIQALINIGVTTGVVPYTGVALPFISFGGSSMVTSMASVGLLLGISRGNRTRKRPTKRDSDGGSYQRASLDRRWGNRGARLSRSGSRTGARHTRR